MAAEAFYRHFKSLLLKEVLLARSTWRQVLSEFVVIALLCLTLCEFSLDWPQPALPVHDVYASSTETSTMFSEQFSPDFGGCLDPAKSVGVVSSSSEFLARLKGAVNLQSESRVRFKEFRDETAMKEFAVRKPEPNTTEGLCMGIALHLPDKGQQQHRHYAYTLFPDRATVPHSDPRMYSDFAYEPRLDEFVALKPLGSFQAIIDSLILKLETRNNSAYIAYAYKPTTSFESEKRTPLGGTLMINIVTMISFIVAIISMGPLLATMQAEKVGRNRDFMSAMGMRDTAYYMASFAFFAVVAIPKALLLSGAIGRWVLTEADALPIFISCYLLILSAYPLAVIFNAVFRDVKTAQNVSSLLLTCTVISLIPAVMDASAAGTKAGLSVLSPLAFWLSVRNIASRETFGWYDVGATMGGYSVDEGWLLTVAYGAGFMVLGLYLDNVLPNMAGVRRPWHYPFHCSYWFAKSAAAESSHVEMRDLLASSVSSSSSDQSNEAAAARSLFEPADPTLIGREDCLDLRNVSKTYEDGKVALANLTLRCYRGQTLVLLGHNGAGKTTALSVLTRMLAPTAGQARIEGTDLFGDPERLRGVLGVCPQEGIFYEKLTVEDHLRVFSSFKGVSYEGEAKQAIERDLEELGLAQSREVRTELLSGGQKRKLAVLLALIGSPRLLVLDEPSSGLDVSARQKLWTILRARKRNCIIIMSTHSMDEAEEMGDRIAIMAEGKVRCCGSAMFLKKRYDAGYQLTLVKSKGHEDLSTEISELIGRHVDGARLESSTSTEMKYRLPFSAEKNFSVLFRELDEKLEQVGISSYGVTVTSLEDVFLKVGTEDRIAVNVGDSSGSSFSLVTCRKHSTIRNVWAISCSVWLRTLRTFSLFFNELLLPFVLLAVDFTVRDFGVASSTYTYRYGPDQLPVPQSVPINNMTLYNESTVPLRNIADGYRFLPYIGSENGDADLAYKNAVATPRAFGAYFVPSFSRTNLNALIISDPVYPESGLLFANLLSNTYLRLVTHAEIEMTVSPMEMYSEASAMRGELVLVFIVVVYTGFVFSSPCVSVICTIVKERKSGLRFMQFVHGVSAAEYWMGKFVADYLKLLVPIGSVIVLESWFDVRVPYYAAILVVSLFPAMPLSYLASFWFDDEKFVSNALSFLPSLSGPLAAIVTIGKLAILTDSPEHAPYIVIPDLILRLLPTYNLSATLTAAAYHEWMQPFPSPMAFHFLGECVLMSAVSTLVFVLMVARAEARMSRELRRDIPLASLANENIEGKDSDVREEEARVQGLEMGQTAVLCRNARKEFGPLVAVDRLSFSLDRGDVFALLGANGAGKTTAFRLLVRQEKPTAGEFAIQCHNLYSPSAAGPDADSLGYCPQESAVFDALTVRENIQFYATIKGVPDGLVAPVTDHVVSVLGLEPEQSRQAWKLSGGNKRKLCMAVALVGYPSVLILDEPSTGLDPRSRQDLWHVISKITAEKRCGVLLTTHSMEEVEALATKVGIMVKGNLRCYGPVQHLKNRYGDSYTIDLRLSSQSLPAEMLGQPAVHSREETKSLLSRFGLSEGIMQDSAASGLLSKLNVNSELMADEVLEFGLEQRAANLIETRAREALGPVEATWPGRGRVRIRVPRGPVARFSTLFAFGEGAKSDGIVQGYSVRETTLGHIFQRVVGPVAVADIRDE